jgi:hypothetical protein
MGEIRVERPDATEVITLDRPDVLKAVRLEVVS